MQHDPFSWQVGPDAFELVDTQSEESLFLDGTINRWLDQVDDGQKKEFVTTIFDLLDSSGAVTLSEINEDKWASWSAILKAMMKLDPEKQKVMKNTLKDLAVVSKDAILDEARKAFDALREKPAEDVGKSNL